MKFAIALATLIFSGAAFADTTTSNPQALWQCQGADQATYKVWLADRALKTAYVTREGNGVLAQSEPSIYQSAATLGAGFFEVSRDGFTILLAGLDSSDHGPEFTGFAQLSANDAKVSVTCHSLK